MKRPDWSCLRNEYFPQGNPLLWNGHEHIIMEYYVVLPHSSFISKHIVFKEHVSVKTKLYQDTLKTPCMDRGLILHISKV